MLGYDAQFNKEALLQMLLIYLRVNTKLAKWYF
jgi:hypothetical protein